MSVVSPANRLTPAQAAVRLGISRTTIDRMKDRGEGPEYLQLGGRTYYDPEKLDKWLEGQRRIPGQSTAKTSPPQQTAA